MGLGRSEPYEPTPISAAVTRGGDAAPPGDNGVSRSNQFTLLQTKLTPPRSAQPDRLQKRERLIKNIRTGIEERLVLVSAPAGFGKTTLIYQSLSDTDQDRSIAWFSIDERDNDPTRFVAYLIGALQRSVATPEKAALFAVPEGASSLEGEIELVLNRLSTIDRQIVLVIDDYHRITNPTIHGLMDYLIEFMPAVLHLIIVTRFDPPLPIARWRSRGELTEVRMEDLSFTVDEIATFLSLDVSVRAQQRLLSRIYERTDGWAFALNTLKSLRRQSESPEGKDLLDGFVGNRRDLADFLVEEILRSMPAERRRFLLKTSILARLNGPLCDAVTGETNGQAMLQALEHDGLPIFALDNRRISYRYHHLLTELLVEQLFEEIGEAGVTELHLRASHYLEGQQQVEEAIQHAIEAKAWDRAFALMVRIGLDLATFRNTLTMRRWLETFPEEYIGKNPSLSFWMGQSLSSTCQPDRARRYLDQAEARWRELEETSQLGMVQVARAWCSILEGNLEESLNLAEQARELNAIGSTSVQSMTNLVYGVALSRAGRATEASSAIAHVVERESQPRVLAVERGRVAMLAGRYEEAVELLGVGIANDNVTDLVRRGHIWLAEIAFERGEFSQASVQLDWAEEAANQLDTKTILPLIEVPRARLLWSRREFEGAFELLEEVIGNAIQDAVPSARMLCESVRAGFWLDQGRVDEVRQWLLFAEKFCSASGDYSQFEHDLVEARYRTLNGNGREALNLLGRMRASAKESGRNVDVGVIAVLEAQAYHSIHQRDSATASLRLALSVLRPGWIIRPFIDRAADLRGTLTSIAASGDFLDYITFILRHSNEVQHEQERTSTSLRDPLSVRELEVLRLVSIGLSNRAISDELFISVPTVKRHLSTIFEKLEVSSRTQAVSLARSLRLI